MKSPRRALCSLYAAVLLFSATLPARGQQPQSAATDALLAEVRRLATAVETLRQQVADSQAEARQLRTRIEELESHLSASTPARTAEQQALADAREREEQDLLHSMVETQYQTKVESGSRYRVKLSGMALFNAFLNQRGEENIDNPQVATNDSTGRWGSFGATLRHSQIGLDLTGPTVAGAHTSGSLHFDFAGGFTQTENGYTSALPRLRTGGLRLDWNRTALVIGQEEAFISPLAPTSFASSNVPPLSYSGNLWAWTPQILVEHSFDVGEKSSVVWSGGILDPLSGEGVPDKDYLLVNAGQRRGMPALASRIGWQRREADPALAFGAGTYFTRQDWGTAGTVDGWALTTDWKIPLGTRFVFSGEAYRGRAMGGLGAGENGSVLFTDDPALPSTRVRALNTAGGWVQFKYKATSRMEFNTAFGEDNPFSSDLRKAAFVADYPRGAMGRNSAGFTNLIFQLKSNLFLSGEYRRIWSHQPDGTRPTANHLNLGAGILF